MTEPEMKQENVDAIVLRLVDLTRSDIVRWDYYKGEPHINLISRCKCTTPIPGISTAVTFRVNRFYLAGNFTVELYVESGSVDLRLGTVSVSTDEMLLAAIAVAMQRAHRVAIEERAQATAALTKALLLFAEKSPNAQTPT